MSDPPHDLLSSARVRSRPHSPTDPSSSRGLHHDRDPQPHRVPAKRARKAINCEPCRSSKLKCDRSRPCSSCVLRGTSHLCYQNQDPSSSRIGDDSTPRVLDAPFEFSKIRHSLALLESQFLSQHRATSQASSSTFGARTTFDFSVSNGPPTARPPLSNGTTHASYALPKQEESDRDLLDPHIYHRSSTDTLYYRRETTDYPLGSTNPYGDAVPGGASESAPGAHGRSGQGGFYAGPTSAVSHLTSDARDNSTDTESESDVENTLASAHEQSPSTSTLLFSPLPSPSDSYASDRDLVSLLPHFSLIDGLLDYYFDYCTWVYRHVHRGAFSERWARYKRGRGAERLVLGTACLCMAVALHYLPDGHELASALGLGANTDRGELGVHWYNVMRVALQRRQAESRAYTLELVELQLVRTHYLTLSKIDSEEIWAVKSELIGVATAMGLHRDPDAGPGPQKGAHGHGGMSEEMKERRRWAWWHVILLERWQAFMFGRPLAIAAHHFDTALPSPHGPGGPPPNAPPDALPIYASHLALFRLAHLLGDIMDSAISLQPVAYDVVLAHDRRLQAWWDALPPALLLGEWDLNRVLRSADTPERRRGVQSVVLRTAFLHIRFTVHRPWAGRAEAYAAAGAPTQGDPRVRQSWDTAVHAASELVALVAQARPEAQPPAALAVPGHMNWGPVHVFSAAMFFCFQLVRAPAQAGGAVLRANVVRAVDVLERAGAGGLPVAAKALAVLRVLGPLYAEKYVEMDEAERERTRSTVLGAVRRLAFPYHDSPNSPVMRRGPGGVVEGVGTMAGYAQAMQPPPPPQMGAALPAASSSMLSMQSKTLPSLRWAPVQTSIGAQQPPTTHHPHVPQQRHPQQQSLSHRTSPQESPYAQGQAISPTSYTSEGQGQMPPPQQQQQQQSMQDIMWSQQPIQHPHARAHAPQPLQPPPQQPPPQHSQVHTYQITPTPAPMYVDTATSLNGSGMVGYAGAGMGVGMGMGAEESIFWGTNVGAGFGQGEWGHIFEEAPAPGAGGQGDAYGNANGRGQMMMDR
ncbi:hypothetical protein DENSPDRAFT_823763 [Dentipellis sp. KUC8613]|nr:hypothetical protein DENSPDRAFT_823763 [Dentipellis sp. KUC8613]